MIEKFVGPVRLTRNDDGNLNKPMRLSRLDTSAPGPVERFIGAQPKEKLGRCENGVALAPDRLLRANLNKCQSRVGLTSPSNFMNHHMVVKLEDGSWAYFFNVETVCGNFKTSNECVEALLETINEPA